MTAGVPNLADLTTRRASLRQGRIVCAGGRVRGLFRWAVNADVLASQAGSRVFVAPVGSLREGIRVRVWDRHGNHLCDADYEEVTP
jgi:hypothetical protein